MFIHEYIQIKFLTCAREVGDPTLSHNIDLKHGVPKAKQKKIHAHIHLNMSQEPFHSFWVNVKADVTQAISQGSIKLKAKNGIVFEKRVLPESDVFSMEACTD